MIRLRSMHSMLALGLATTAAASTVATPPVAPNARGRQVVEPSVEPRFDKASREGLTPAVAPVIDVCLDDEPAKVLQDFCDAFNAGEQIRLVSFGTTTSAAHLIALAADAMFEREMHGAGEREPRGLVMPSLSGASPTFVVMDDFAGAHDNRQTKAERKASRPRWRQ